MVTRSENGLEKSWPIMQLIRYVLTGGLNTALSYVIFASLIALHVNPYVAQIIGYMAGMATSFIVNARWTFSRQTTNASMFYRFVGVNLLLLLFSSLLLRLALTDVTHSALLAQAMTLIPITMVGYVLNKIYVFRGPREHGGSTNERGGSGQ